MKRYCIEQCKKEDFVDTEVCSVWDINYQRVVEYVKEKNPLKVEKKQYSFSPMESFNLLISRNSGMDLLSHPQNGKRIEALKIGNSKLWKEFNGVIFSAECELDVLNDVYLSVVDACGHTEKLFLQDWYLEDGSEEGILASVKMTIKNESRSKKTSNLPLIFDMQNINSTKKDMEIPDLGSGIVRLWLSSKDFRNLFIKAEKRTEKYDVNKIVDILKEGKTNNIRYKTDDYIILEKLLGINTFFTFKYCLLDKLNNEARDPELIREFVQVLSKCKGMFSRCLFIFFASNYILKNIDNELVIVTKNKIKECIILLEESIKEYNRLYLLSCNMILKEYMKIYSCDKTKKDIEHQRNMAINDHYVKLPYIYNLEIDKIEENPDQGGKPFAYGDPVKRIMEESKKEGKVNGYYDPVISNMKHEVFYNMLSQYPYLINGIGEVLPNTASGFEHQVFGWIIDENYQLYNGLPVQSA